MRSGRACGVGQGLPNGAGTTALREIVYFGGHGAGAHLWLVVGYVVVGMLVALLASGHGRHAVEQGTDLGEVDAGLHAR